MRRLYERNLTSTTVIWLDGRKVFALERPSRSNRCVFSLTQRKELMGYIALGYGLNDDFMGYTSQTSVLRAPRRGTAGVALQAGAVADQREVRAFRAGLAT